MSRMSRRLMMFSSLNQVVAEGVLHARRIQQRTAAEKPHDVGDQRVMTIDREGQPRDLVLECLACRVADLQGFDQAEIEGLLDVVGQVMADEHWQDLRDELAVR